MSFKNLKCEITQSQLQELLRYDPDTGNFFWRITKRQSKMKAGKPAGFTNGLGYHNITINHKAYLAHRLAWLYVHGHWPAKYIDHIDGNPSNNAISNLREADQFENQQNARHRGYTRNQEGSFSAFIRVRGKYVYLGRFPTPELARSAYLEAKAKYHGEFCPVERAA